MTAPRADDVDRHVLEAVDVRLRSGRVPVPDLVVTGDIDFDELVGGGAVLLVREITSPPCASTGRTGSTTSSSR